MPSNKCVCFFIVTLAVAVMGQIPNLGYCPDYLPMSEFDMSRFLGKWYEAERYFTFSEVASRCVVTDYAKATSGRIYVSNEVTNRLTGVKRVINGNMQLVGKGDEGKLHVKYATTPIPTETTFMVLETDYDNYAVVWSCSGFGPVHAQNAWLMTRERLPSGTVLQKAYGILDKFKISRTFFVKTDQEGCALAASDINAANGITATSTIPEATGSDQRSEPIKIETQIKPETKPEEEIIKPESEKIEIKPEEEIVKPEVEAIVKPEEKVEEVKVEEEKKTEVDAVAEVIIKRSEAEIENKVD